MINYNTASMHLVGKTIQNNGKDMQGYLQTLWSYYHSDTAGTFPAFLSCLTGFQDLCKDASGMLAQDRIALGTKLDQAATAAEREEAKIRQTFRGHVMPQ